MEYDELIDKAIRGDKKALVTLIMDRRDEYFKLAFSYMKKEEDSMDCLQDMIVKLYTNIHKLKNKESFYSWSKTILVNICKDKISENKKIVYLENSIIESIEDESRGSDNMELKDLIGRLDILYSEVIYMKYILDYDYQTIGKILDIPLGTVKSRIHKGKKLLQVMLEGGESGVR